MKIDGDEEDLLESVERGEVEFCRTTETDAEPLRHAMPKRGFARIVA